MAVNLTEKTADQLLNIDGVQLFTARAGIKQTDRADLTLMVLAGGNTVSPPRSSEPAPSGSCGRTWPRHHSPSRRSTWPI